MKTCLSCESHDVIPDPDPDDWFNDDDVAIICKLKKDTNVKPNSKHLADRCDFAKVAVACRPYNLRKEAAIPKWCPKKKK